MAATAVPVKLTAAERKTIAKQVRKLLREDGYDPGWGVDSARVYIETRIDDLGRFDGVEYTEISDYAIGFARFICSAEAREC